MILKLFRNNFFIALLLLGAYMSTNPYIYGWDDQHLEIPILKHMIDPSMYKGDYYVESAAKYFTSWLYPVLAKLITIKQIPATYLLLFLVSRYVMFYWVFRLWSLICGSGFSALCTSFAFLILGRTDEFLYRSFCHEEFSFMFMFAGLYCFYKDRYWLAALIWGLGVNFHAIYNLFPMLYMLAFLLFCHPQRIRVIFQTGIIFVAASLPFLCWQIPISISREVVHPVAVNEWMPLYLLSCFQNFIFGYTPLNEVLGNIHKWWGCCAPYLLLTLLYVFNLVFNPLARRDKKLYAIMGVSYLLLGVEFFFDYIHPSRFSIDLNLIRVEQYMRFFMMGYTVIWACEQVRASKPWLALAAAVLVLACGTSDLIALLFLGAVSLIFIIDANIPLQLKPLKAIGWSLLLLAAGALVYMLPGELKTQIPVPVYWGRFFFVIASMAAAFVVLLFLRDKQWLRRLIIIIPILGTYCICVYDYHRYNDFVKTGSGGWQLQRNWLDMQYYVRDHTPKDATVLTPYDMPMGGFRIHSERKVVVCYRDCGIIGFDYAAAVEWNNRIQDIKAFRVFSKDAVDQSVLVAIVKYKADYIVFMKYYAPDQDTPVLKKVYENEVFSLFQVV
jgi:hypothetical protein